MEKKSKIIFIAIILAIIIGGFICYSEETVKIPIKTTVIDATFNVLSVEYKLIEKVGFGGAGGIVSVTITTDSPEDFLEMIPSNVTIYKTTEECNQWVVEKFIAPSDNQVFIYEDSYSMDGFAINEYVPGDYVVFYKNNIMFLIGFIFLLMFLCAVFIVFIIDFI